MTSGEVLFILAFIVLPTAVLVSSVWAVVFVRKRPDRLVREPQVETSTDVLVDEPETESADLASDQETVVAPAITRTEEVTTISPVQANEDVLIGPDIPDTATPQAQPVAAEPLRETAVAQTTEDLDEVVALITELDPVVAEERPREGDADASQTPIHDAVASEDVDPAIFQTSELPIIEPELQSQPQPRRPEPAPQADRRRRDVRLLPTETDVPRKRGRSRDPERRVPRLGRASRKRAPSTDRDSNR